MRASSPKALGRHIRYRDVPIPAWSEGLRQAKLPEHLVSHLSVMAALTKQGRYDRLTDDLGKLTDEHAGLRKAPRRRVSAWTGRFLRRSAHFQRGD
jgi:hypothetical protein